MVGDWDTTFRDRFDLPVKWRISLELCSAHDDVLHIPPAEGGLGLDDQTSDAGRHRRSCGGAVEYGVGVAAVCKIRAGVGWDFRWVVADPVGIITDPSAVGGH